MPESGQIWREEYKAEMTREEIREFYDSQLKDWELAYRNVNALQNVETKDFAVGDLKGKIQFNPARAVSSLAKTDAASIAARKCFLCSNNRPREQRIIEILPEWELLVNPYPILPYHFTIASCHHTNQVLPIETGFKLAEKLQGMVVFYNDSGAGASAPDHLHFQAVPKDLLPLVKIMDKKGDDLESIGELPFKVITDIEELGKVSLPVNAYFWISDKGKRRFMAIPRGAHRPSEYYKDVPERRAISPGAIDMAGVLVCPIKEDFDAITNQDIAKILKQVGLPIEE